MTNEEWAKLTQINQNLTEATEIFSHPISPGEAERLYEAVLKARSEIAELIEASEKRSVAAINALCKKE